MLETTCVEDDVDCVHNDVQELPSTALTLFPTPTLIGNHIHSEPGEMFRLSKKLKIHFLYLCV